MKKRNLLALSAAAAIAASMLSVTAYAEGTGTGKGYTAGLTAATDGTDLVSNNTVSFEKYLVMDKKANVPNAAFNFAISRYDSTKAEKKVIVDADADHLAVINGIEGVTFSVSNQAVFAPTDSTTDENAAAAEVVFTTPADTTDEKYAQKTLTLDFSSVTFDEPGVYRYLITEADSSQAFDNDAAPKRTLDVYVEDYADFYSTLTAEKQTEYTAPTGKELFIANYVIYNGDVTTAPAKDGTNTTLTKSSSYTNTYITHDLTFSKTVAGNQGSKDKYFKFEVTITGGVAGIVYDVDLTNADGTVADNAATVYAGETNPVKLTADADGKAVGVFYLQHGQNITILGLADGTAYEIKETPEDYVPAAEVTGDAKKNDDSAVVLTDNAVADDGLKDDTTVAFTNTREGVIPTGILLSVAVPVVIGAVVLAGIVFLVVRNKKREAEEE